MKLSNYIVEYHEGDGHLLTNLYSGSDLYLDNEQYAEYRRIVLNLPEVTESELYKCLRAQLFIVDDCYDEFSLMELKRKVAVFNLTPVEVKYVIAPTLACNAKCSYCYEKDVSAKKTMSSSTAAELTRFIQKNASGKRRLNVSWFGGEPLLNTDVISSVSENVISFCEENSIEFFSNMTTNGILIDQHIDLIKRCKIDSVQITLDGTKEVYEAVKSFVGVDDAFDRVLDNIFLLTQHGIFVSIRMNVSKENVEDLKQLCCQLLSDSRWNDKIDVYFHPLMDYTKISNEYLRASEYEMMFSNLYQNLFDLGYYISPKQFRVKPRTLSCYGWDMTTFAIGPDGELYNCQHELGQSEFVVGDIQTGLKISQGLLKGRNGDIASYCKDCRYLPVCQGGCYYAMRAGNAESQCQTIKFELDIRMKLLYNLIKTNRYNLCEIQ